MRYTKKHLQEVIERQRKWLHNESGGESADLSGADLSGADLSGADLSGADLRGSNLSQANLTGANLSRADLRGSDLTGADLRWSNLSQADLTGANLSRANLDFSAWPFGCVSLDVVVDKRIVAQLLYHALRAMQSCADDADVAAVLASKPCLRLANQFHRVKECGCICTPSKGDNHAKND